MKKTLCEEIKDIVKKKYISKQNKKGLDYEKANEEHKKLLKHPWYKPRESQLTGVGEIYVPKISFQN